MLIWQLILIQVGTFVLIVLFLRWLLYSHIGKVLRRLRQLNQQNLKKEKALKEDLEKAKKATQKEIEQGQNQAEEIRSQAKEDGEKDRESILGKAREEAKRLINEAERDCQRKKTELVLETREKAVYLAADMIRYIFTERGRENLHIQLIDELLGEIEGLEEGRVVKAEGGEVEVICACRLEDAQKKRLKEVLRLKLNRAITLTEKLDEEIIAGLIIRLGGFVIDGSIKNKMKKILPMIKERAKEL